MTRTRYVAIAAVVALAACRPAQRAPAGGGDDGGSASQASIFPVMAHKPEPREITFDGCPPEGDGGDRALNRLKNRVDAPQVPVAIPLDSLLALPWPDSAARRDRSNWSSATTREVARYEGIPVVTTGYLVRTKLEGPESPNCHGADRRYRDYHIWMTARPDTARSHALVVEATPRVRADRPAWTTTRLQRVAREHQAVRITGWLMLDPEHPEQLGKTRGTLWEIHPITGIEIQRRGRWVPLEAGSRKGH